MNNGSLVSSVMAEPAACGCAMRGTGVVSTACDPGVLEEDVLDDELDELELELPGPCATSVGATTTPPTSNATAAAAIGSRRGAIHSRRGASSMRRVAILSRRMAIISRRVAM